LLPMLLEFDAFYKVSQTTTGTQRVEGGVMGSDVTQGKDCRGVGTREWMTRSNRTQQNKAKQS
jgi:hypothetical protein